MLDRPCLVVPGVSHTPRGYARCGILRFGVTVRLRHRLAWIDAHGQLPPPETPLILHRCDNPPCEEPTHLYAGTHADNSRDAHERGRAHLPPSVGEKNGRARLGEDDVRLIRELHESGWSQDKIALQFSVRQQTISYAIRGVTWAHVH